MNQNVYYIGMPSDQTATDNIEVEALGRTLKAVTNIYPITIIDAGNELTPLAIKALEFSTLIFVIVTPDILALNQTKRLYSELVTMMFPKDMIQFIVNQAQQGHPVTNDVIAKTLGKAVFSAIPRDDQNCTLALNQKKPVMLVARNSAFAKGVVDTVRRLSEKSILKTLEKLNKPSDVGAKKTEAGGTTPEGGVKTGKSPWTELKSRIHRALVEEMDLKKADENDPKAQIILKEQTKKVVVDFVGQRRHERYFEYSRRYESNRERNFR